ncbi:MAG: hypothetical protein JWN24_4586 [Phycisphaerales bacterium]|nr:hypothetical protein [Phycisphaerales bacterium]
MELIDTPIVSKTVPTPFVESRTNMLFAWGVEEGVPFSNPFDGTGRITIPPGDGMQAGLEVVAGNGAHVETYFDASSGCCVYRWGIAAHPDVPALGLLKWILGVVNSGDASALCQVVGTFIILIDDRRSRRVRMVSDVLGLRPWHVGQDRGHLVCGSDVWSIQQAGFDMGGVNYDAVAAWLRMIFDCTEMGLFKNFPPIGYGVVATWDAGGYSESRYFKIEGGLKTPPPEELIEGMHRRISRTFDALTRDLDRVSIALSGGFDSRYLAALGVKRKDLKIEAFCVCDEESEGIGASMVAQALELPLQVLRTDGSIWNMYAEPFHFTPGGFPITKQLSYVAASQRPGVPCLSGFFGDPMNRGSLDRLEEKLEREIQEDLPVAYHRSFVSKHTLARFDLLDPKVIERSDERILEVLRRRFAQWTHTSHPILGVSLVAQQRHYMSNNILQHLNVAEALIPFFSWESIQFKMQNDAACFSYDVYGKLLDTYFPQMSHIPHNSKIACGNHSVVRPSRCTRKWAMAVLAGLPRSNCMSLLNRRKAVPRLIGALMGRRDVEVVAMFLYRLHLLDERCRRCGVAFDWDEI